MQNIKKSLSAGLAVMMVLSQLQAGFIVNTYASDLQSNKDQTIEALEKTEVAIDKVVVKLDEKLSKNTTKQKRLEKKAKEIEQYLEKTKKEIKQENSSGNIQKKASEAKRVVLMKVVSGITEYEDTTQNISKNIAASNTEILKAKNTIKQSLKTEDGNYSIFVKTKFNRKKLQKLFSKLDNTITSEFLYKSGKNNYFEVFIPKGSLFQQEMLEDISKAQLPKAFLKIEIVTPDVFKVENNIDKKTKKLLKGEDLTQIWGVEQLQTYNYFLDTRKSSKKIKIAVIDTGIDYTHPDLEKRVAKNLGRDFVNKDRDGIDDQGHGTHVAGTIAASVNKGGIIGVNPYTRLVPIKICDSNGFCPTYAVLRALNYSKKKNIDIVNMSLGGRGNPTDHEICGAISDYTANGGIVVAASGNAGINTNEFVPGGCSDAITVGAYDKNKATAVFSNYGDKVDISAPGVDIYSTKMNGDYHQLSGTSMAAPHISGVVSLMKAYNPDIGVNQIKPLLKNNSDANKSLNIDSLMNSVQNPADENIVIQPEEEDIEENENINSEAGESDTKDDAIINLNIVKGINFKRENSGSKPESFDPTITSVQDTQIDFGELNSIVEINSENTNQIQKIDIDEKQEELKQYLQPQDLKVFDEQGKQINESDIQINSLEQTQKVEPTTGKINISDIPDNIFNTDENIQDIEDEIEVQQIFIDGAEKNINIQNSENFEVRPLEFEEYSKGENINSFSGELIPLSLEENKFYTHDDFVNLNTKNQINDLKLDDDGNFIGPNIQGYEPGDEIFGDPNKNEVPTNIEASIEKINTYQDSLIIDGENNQKNSGVSISNVGEPENIELENIENFSEQIIESDYIPEVEVSAFTGEYLEATSFSELEGKTIDSGEIPELTEEQLDAGGIGIQRTYSCSVTLKEKCKFRIYRSSNYTFQSDVNNIANYTTSRDYLTFDTKGIGTAKYELYRYDRLYYTIFITVNEPEYEFEKNIEVYEGDRIRISNPPKPYGTWVKISYGGYARISGSPIDLTIEGERIGNDVYYLMNYKTNEFYYKLNIEVKKKPPIIVPLEMYIGTEMNQGYLGIHHLDGKIELSNNNISTIGMGYNTFKIIGEKIGTTEIYASYEGRHTHTFVVTVKEKPVPKEYNIQLVEGQSTDIYLPESGYNYRYSAQSGNTGSAYLHNYDGYVKVTAGGFGDISLNIYDKLGVLHYIIHTHIIPKPPVEMSTSIYEGRITSMRINDADEYDYAITQSGSVSLKKTSSRLYATGGKPGSVHLILSKNGVERYIIDIEVKELPEPEYVDINIQELEETTIQLPIGSRGISVSRDDTVNVTHSYNRYNGILKISGKVYGEAKYTITNHSTTFIDYILNITVIPEPPEIREVSVWETKHVNLGDFYSSNAVGKITASDPNGINAYKINSRVYIEGKQAGEYKLYLYNSLGRQHIMYNVTVIPAPETIIYNYDFTVNQNGEVTLPENISSYTFSRINDNIFRDYKGRDEFEIIGDNTFSFGANRPGESTLYLKNDLNFDIYVINISVKPYEIDFTLYKTESRDPGLNSSNRHYTNDSNVAYIRNSDEVYGNNPGTAVIESHDEGIHERTVNVTVLPIPDPIIIKCDLYKGERCLQRGSHGGVTYTASRDDAFDVDYGNSTVNVKALAVGTATIYIKARHGDYIKWQMDINVLPTPPQIFDCEIPAGTECQTKWYDRVNDIQGYEITSTDSNIVNVQIEQYFDIFGGSQVKMERTLIEGISPGYAEVYFYDNYDHRATIKVTVGEPVPSIGVSNNNMTIHQGEKITTNITQGGGEYKQEEYNSDIISFDVDNNDDGKTGEINITGRNAGIDYPVFKDKYNQTHNLKVTVEDTKLILYQEEITLDGSNSEYISVKEAHTGIKSFTKNNDHVSAFFKTLEDGEKVIEVKAKSAGTTILEVRDYDTDAGSDNGNGNVAWVTIHTSGGSTPDPNPADPTDPATDEEVNIDDIDALIEKILRDLGIQTVQNNKEIKINSLSASYLCELGDSNIFWAKPASGYCIDQSQYIAWSCGINQSDMSSVDGTQSCISNEFKNGGYTQVKDQLLNLRNSKRDLIQSKTYTQSSWLSLLSEIDIYQQTKNVSNIHSTRKAVYNYILDDMRNEIQKKISSEYKKLADVNNFYTAIVQSTNNGYIGDLYNPEYSGKSRSDIEYYAQRFSEELFEYNLSYDQDFKDNYNSYIAENGSDPEIKDGIKDGIIEGTKDYLMSYHDIVKGAGELWGLSFDSVKTGATSVWDFITNPVENLTAIYDSSKNAINSIYDKILVLTGYEKSKGSTYTSTQISLSTADPVGKVVKIAGAGFFTKIINKVDSILISNLKYSNKILTQMNTRGWSKIDIENAIKTPFKKGKSTDNYDGKSDPATAYFVSDNQYAVINNITGDVVQISDKGDLGWVIDARIYDIK